MLDGVVDPLEASRSLGEVGGGGSLLFVFIDEVAGWREAVIGSEVSTGSAVGLIAGFFWNSSGGVGM